jgi:pSer/pThr/pTyr-binding forkhead associated (FHA) protein
MTLIKNILSGEEIILLNQHTIGRDTNSLCCISEDEVSCRHAIIYWESDGWCLTDCSSNGTKVNNTHLHQQTIKLKENDVIKFSNSRKGKWKLINSNKPNSFF